VQNWEGDRTKIVVGLGNPGRPYAGTRHNVGFEVIESLRARNRLGEGRKAFQGVVTEWRPQDAPGVGRVLLLQPHTFMNLSGQSASQCATFYKVPPPDVLVVLDDLALPLGQVRARKQGSAGGHKGLSDVLSALGTEQVARLRIGIGSPPKYVEAVEFVLGVFRPGERPVMEEALAVASQAVEDWVAHGIEFVMNRYNQKSKEEPPKAESSS
jgi:peptidyl-tRNA hydrolase, PTH1 family